VNVDDATTPVPGRGGDGGYALVTVIGSMFALTVLAMAALGAALGGLPQSKAAQADAAAMAAAQAGVADLTTQVNLCRDYWVNPSACAPVDFAAPDADGWRAVQGSDPVQNARYRIKYVVTPEAVPGGGTTVQNGLIRVEVAGRVDAKDRPAGVQRRVTVDLRQPGFLQYIYYSDFEAVDPAILAAVYPERRYDKYVLPVKNADGTTTYTEFTDVSMSGISVTQAQACNRYWYGPGGPTDTRTTPSETFKGTSGGKNYTATLTRPCDLKFAGTDVVNGPLHTNDAILLEQGVTFASPTTHTSWRNPPGTTPPPAEDDSSVNWFRQVTLGAQPSTSGYRPRYKAPVTMPWRQSDTRTAAGRGCLYTGPTSVEFLSTGRIKVHSPYSRNLSADCGGSAVTTAVQEVPGPVNGVIHVQNRARDSFWSSSPCPEKVLGLYPMTDTATGIKDITKYPCTDGDAFVKGTAGRPLTISTENDVVVTDDVTVAGGTTGPNVVGLVAQGHVEVYHPVGCSYTVTAPKVCGDTDYKNLPTDVTPPTTDLVVQAAVISMAHSFTVQNFEKGTSLGTLSVTGGIYQRFRGPVGFTLDAAPAGASGPVPVKTGFPTKNYLHDKRMLNLPPPAFPVPVGTSWAVTHFAEQTA
jgi:hypothetical protein